MIPKLNPPARGYPHPSHRPPSARRAQASLGLIAVALALATAVAGQSDRPEAAAARNCPTVGDEAVTSILKSVRNQHDLPAMAAAVVTSQGLRVQGAVGVRKRGTDVAVTLDDLWHLGSDTKAMTAVLVGRLVERGQLRWESTPADVLPDLAPSFHDDFKPVTILHLLSHRAGVRANLNWPRLARQGSVQEQRIEAVRQAFAEKPEHAPGSTHLYSNLGYVIAGAMIERVTGTSWEQAMRTEVFGPLKMRTAGFGGLGTKGETDQPWGHLSGGRAVRENGPAVDNPPVLGPAGTVHCTIRDWARFIADFLRGARGESALLKPATYEVLLRPPYGGDYALGWSMVERSWGGGTVLNHCGCNTMYYANAWLAPKRDFAVLVCANQGLDAFAATDEAAGQLIRGH